MPERQLTFFDRCILQADQALRTIFAEPVGSGRENPAQSDTDEPLSATEKAESISLMRINHAGEVCAQALYQGQALTARTLEVRYAAGDYTTQTQDYTLAARPEIDTVVVGFTDHYGRLHGKRYDAEFFVEGIHTAGTHGCDYLLTVDMEMEPVPGYDYASWELGYGDVHLVADIATLARAGWTPSSAIVLCDWAGRGGGLL